MTLKNRNIESKASGLKGKITGFEDGHLKITFTNYQDISVPLNKAELLLTMDEETLEEVHELLKKEGNKVNKHKTKVQTYMDDYEEEFEEEEDDEILPPILDYEEENEDEE